MRRIGASLLLLLLPWLTAIAQAPRYFWKNVQIVGGGFVDGIVFDRIVPGLRYARTDIGGAYRWDETAHRWVPLMDWVSYKDRNLMGVASVAIDPSNPNRLYLACGTYSNAATPDGAILRSNNQGRTFQRTNVPFKFGANEDGRGNGERLAVDPQDGRVLYVGTRHDGLWRSRDRGVTWTRVTSFPDVTEPGKAAAGDGIVFVHFVPQPAAKQGRPTQTIYVGVSLMGRPNLFVSKDAGATWHPVADAPTQYRPTRAALSSDGFLYVAYGTAPGPSPMKDGAVWKLNTRTGAWSDITPDRPGSGREFGYAAVAVDAHHPGWILASTFGRPWSDGASDTIFRSTDGGATWKPLFGGKSSGILDSTGAPYVKSTPIHWLFDIEIDPADSNHAVFTTGYGGWETHDLTAADRNQPTHWTILATGIEETVALALDSPAEGAPLISGIGDYGGFVHWDLDRPAPEGSSAPPRFGNTTDVESGSLRPQVVVRVGINADHAASPSLGYSLDGGHSWRATPSQPAANSQGGTVAVSADGGTWIWTPNHQAPFLTHDHGATWSPVQGLPAATRAVADPVDLHAFYAISLANHLLFHSTDGGAMFSSQPLILPNAPTTDPSKPGDPRGGQDRLYAAPGRHGDLWFAASNGLYHLPALFAAESGQAGAFARLAPVEDIQAFGFGKQATQHGYPTLYLTGTVNGQPGVFRSVDEGRGWERINDNQHQWGLILQITGDPRTFGRVYVGTHGRGILYGDPVAQHSAIARRTRASAHH